MKYKKSKIFKNEVDNNCSKIDKQNKINSIELTIIIKNNKVKTLKKQSTLPHFPSAGHPHLTYDHQQKQ